MSLSQPIDTGSLGNPTPKLKLDQSSGNTLNSRAFTIMVWAYHTGGTVNSYQDIISLRDSTIGAGDSDDAVIGLGLHVPGSVNIMNLGDVDTDVDGVQTIADNQWYHYTLVGENVPNTGSPPQRTRLTGYVNSVPHARSSDTELTPPTFPDNDCWIQLFNSRSSETDGGSVFVGHMAGLKAWSNAALTPQEIFREMWSYWPVRTKDVWAVNPLVNKAQSALNYFGIGNFTVQGANFADGALDPPGVSWDWPMARREATFISYLPPPTPSMPIFSGVYVPRFAAPKRRYL